MASFVSKHAHSRPPAKLFAGFEKSSRPKVLWMLPGQAGRAGR